MPTTKEQTDEHPVIFSGWSIRRILASEKTQTRRIVKPQPPQDCPPKTAVSTGPPWVAQVARQDGSTETVKCPYGQPGDALWVREAFRLPAYADDLSPREFLDTKPEAVWAFRYEGDGVSHGDEGPTDYPKGGWGRKRPSIHMPHELCRLRLRLEDVRVERLQEISNEEAVAEGVRGFWCDETQGYDIPDVAVIDGPPRRAFAYVWEDIHGDGAWKENPDVWVVEFSRINNDN